MWLLEDEIKQKMEQGGDYGVKISAEQQQAFEAVKQENQAGARITNLVSNNIAQIKIEGVMTPKPSFLAELFGGGNTTYSQIVSALTSAQANSQVNQIELLIDSPGGNVDGLFDTINVIKLIDKPITAVVNNTAASAAFAIASQAGRIVATNQAARFGSIGVAQTKIIDDHQVEITSTKAPKKRPNPSTQQGKADIVKELDVVHDLFVDAVSKGRGVSAKTINQDFGQGGVVFAQKALEVGMIDEVLSVNNNQVGNKALNSSDTSLKVGGDSGINLNQDENPDLKASNQQKKEKKTMSEESITSLTALQAKHPTLCAEIYESAHKAGTTQERDRVSAHLTFGESSGDMNTASDAIKDGSALTETIKAKYQVAGMNKTAMANRQSESDAAGKVADNVQANTSQDSEAEQVAAMVKKELDTGE